ncbi:MAG: hemerythrin domain-containing protein [Deferrisomatales bacterium]|nr:hemerythrin domain-containing protein [Deferrisomatales bacterium]
MRDVTSVLTEEHRLILRMIDLVEHNTRLVEEGGFSDWDFYLDAVDFIRHYADRFHHAKEEDVLFRELVRNGMPEQNSPVAAMLMAHDQGRAFVRGMEEAARRAKGGDASAPAAVAENARGYAALLRDHIDKEDNILYPLAERVLPAGWRDAMAAEYEGAERPGIQERYQELVERHEERARQGRARASAA